MAVFIDPRLRVRLTRADGTVYVLRSLTVTEWIQFLTPREMEENRVLFDQVGLIELARMALVDWEGVVDAEGNPVPWPGSMAIDGLPVSDVMAIGQKALEMSRLGVVDRKNSEGPPLSPAAG